MGTVLENYFVLLNSKLDRVREAQSLTLIQFKLIDEKKYDELADNLSARDTLMKDFQEYGEKIEQLNIGQMSDEDRKKSEDIKNSIENIMADIRENNVKLRELLVKQKEDCREEIRKLKENERGTKSYINNNLATGSRFFDREG